MKGTKPNLVQARDAIDRVMAPPKWLSAYAKEEWKRAMPSLVERRILTRADLGGLENYCVARGRVREVEEMLQKTGFDPVLCRVQDKAMQTVRQIGAEFGLTPVSRSRPTMRDDTNENDDDNPLNIS